jgi:hypothetical protein
MTPMMGYTYLRIQYRSHYRSHLSARWVQTAIYMKVILHMVSTNIHSLPIIPTLNKSVKISQRYNKKTEPKPLLTNYAVYILALRRALPTQTGPVLIDSDR